MTPPHLPPELEYDIFILAYDDDCLEAQNLILVAKRVYEWLIPHIFKVVVLSNNRPAPIYFNEKTYQKYGHHVHHLLIEENHLREHLPLFPNVINLAFWARYEPIDLPILLGLPLQYLSAGSSMSSPDLFQLFKNVTHLDYIPIFDADDQEIKNTLYLPKLTHLCVVGTLDDASVKLFLEEERCPELKVVAIWAYRGGEVEVVPDTPSPVEDKRVVVLRCDEMKDWKIGARGGVDMWRFAEGVVAKRS